MTRLAISLMFAVGAALPAAAQKPSKPPACVNLTGRMTLEAPGMQIQPDAGGSYPITMFTCAGESGDAVFAPGGSTRRIRRDFFGRLPVIPTDDPAPGWYPGTVMQEGLGGFSVGKLFRGYTATSGYAQDYPHPKCWANGPHWTSCTFTTGVGSTFTGSDGKTYMLKFRNPSADLIALYPRTDSEIALDDLLNSGMAVARGVVTYTRNLADPAQDIWVVTPEADGSGRFVGVIYVNGKRSIDRLGYFDMNFRATITR